MAEGSNGRKENDKADEPRAACAPEESVSLIFSLVPEGWKKQNTFFVDIKERRFC